MSEGAAGVELARQIRTELSEKAPEGFHFTDHVVRQDQALQRLGEQLAAHDDREELTAALSHALVEEHDGWILLKLLELADRLSLPGTADALISVARRPASEDPRSRFLAGRACEVLLRLPLDLAQRARANAVSEGLIEDVQLYRLGAQRAVHLHRPRRVEWALLVGVMLVGLLGLLFGLFALER
jgi:hypothetical protein